MSEQDNAVEQPVEKAPVVKKEEATLPTQNEVDLAAALTEKDLELEQLAKERDNYRRGLLKAKGKIPETEELTDEDRYRQIVREELLASRESQAHAEKEALVKKALKENSELRAALKNRAGMVPSGGSSSHEEVVPDEYAKIFSKEQMEDLKKRGLDPKVVAENLSSPGKEKVLIKK